jgi:hypothetical protein
MNFIIITLSIQPLFHNMSILVNLRLVVQTLSAKKSITKQFVLVYHLILEVLPAVDQNVLSVLNVLMIKHVQIKNVLILVQIHVARTLNAE